MKQIVIFDTSAINALADERSASLEASLKAAFFFRQTETTVAEIAATQRLERRIELLNLCRRLLPAGECICPYHWIVQQMTLTHKLNPADFDWKAVDIVFPALNRELIQDEIFDDELAKVQQPHAAQQNREFVSTFGSARDSLAEIFEQLPSEQPSDLRDLIMRLQQPGGAYWSFGKTLYDRVEEHNLSEAPIREFTAACPPFRALLLAICVAYFQYSVKSAQTEPSYKAGKFDLFSAVYLPFCNRFVTADTGQLNSLKAVCEIGALHTEVISFKDLIGSISSMQSE